MSRRSVCAAVLAAGIATIAAAATVAPALGTSSKTSPRQVITFQEPTPKTAIDDIPPHSKSTLSLGDRLVIGGRLESAAHKRVGTFGGTCTVVGSGRSFVTTPLLCQAVYRTPNGQIEALGMMTLSRTNLIVLGGSGAYAGVHGTVAPGKAAKGFEDADMLTLER